MVAHNPRPTMGKINLTALNVRRTAMSASMLKTGQGSCWTGVVGEIPPAQVLVRQQPIHHTFTKTRTRSLPTGKTAQYTRLVEPKKSKSAATNRRLFSPEKLRYEEDALRKRFFQDHPWELARPRMVLETDGQRHKDIDWSTGIMQPGTPLSGESVVQRQLWLLENIPDITLAQSYDVARKEFYELRRRDETRNRIAAEEAQHMGAQFGMSWNKVGMKIEDGVYNEWEAWGRDRLIEQLAKTAALAGNPLGAEEQASDQSDQGENAGANSRTGPTKVVTGSAAFKSEQGRQQATGRSRPLDDLVKELQT